MWQLSFMMLQDLDNGNKTEEEMHAKKVFRSYYNYSLRNFVQVIHNSVLIWMNLIMFSGTKSSCFLSYKAKITHRKAAGMS